MSVAEKVVAALAGRLEGQGWRCRSVHAGHGLVISDGRDGRLLVRCWAAGDPAAKVYARSGK
jgi:hypothetical protein